VRNRVTFLQHSELDVPGTLGRLIQDAGWERRVCRADRGASSLPTVGSLEVLVVLGSGESVTDASVPWIGPERRLVADAVEAGIPVLGVCFGGQMLAQVLGGVVTRSVDPEVGWREIESLDPARIPTGPWLEWHEDTFTAPPGAEALARTAVSLQAFVAGIHTGVQFHPEVTREIVVSWVDDARQRGRLQPGQDEDLLEGFYRSGTGAETGAATLFDGFLHRAGLTR
jgi:GMP synthase-like glutamine amidotransferase